MKTVHRDIVGAFIFSSDGCLLLGKSQKGGVYKGLWIVPGGGIEPGETKQQATIREIMEETGIDISAYDLILYDLVSTGSSQKILKETGELTQVDMTFYDYIVNTGVSARELVPRCEDDFVDATWHPLNTLAQLELAPPTTEVLQSLGYLPK